MVDGRQLVGTGTEILCGGGGMVSQADKKARVKVKVTNKLPKVAHDDPLFKGAQFFPAPVELIRISGKLICPPCPLVIDEFPATPADNPPE